MTHTREMSSEGMREGLSLSRWFQPFTEQKFFSIPAMSVITSAIASPGLARYYEYVLKRIQDDYDGFESVKLISKNEAEFKYKDGSTKVLNF